MGIHVLSDNENPGPGSQPGEKAQDALFLITGRYLRVPLPFVESVSDTNIKETLQVPVCIALLNQHLRQLLKGS